MRLQPTWLRARTSQRRHPLGCRRTGYQHQLPDGGWDNNDAFTNVNLPFPFPDAIQEFSVQTSGLSARYGIHPGATVNIVTVQAATPSTEHSSSFRNGDMNAKNHFSTKQDTLKRNRTAGFWVDRSARTSCSSSVAIRARAPASKPTR